MKNLGIIFMLIFGFSKSLSLSYSVGQPGKIIIKKMANNGLHTKRMVWGGMVVIFIGDF